MKKTENGFLKGRAFITKPGIFKYKNAQGELVNILRHPDDVFDPESLESLKLTPVTIEHEFATVNADNAHIASVGLLGEMVAVNDNHVEASLNITHKKAIDLIEAGKQELSASYTANIIPEIGEWEGEKYTHRQKNIRYNNVTICDRGRAGRSVRLHCDSEYVLFDSTLTNLEIEMENQEKHEDKKIEKEVKADNRDSTIERLQAQIDQLKDDNSRLKAVDVEKVVNDKVQSRLDLINNVNKVTMLDSEDLHKTDRQIMEKVIKQYSPSIVLDSKSDAYVEARFDAIVESNSTSDVFKKQMTYLDRQDVVAPTTAKRDPFAELVKFQEEYTNNKKKRA